MLTLQDDLLEKPTFVRLKFLGPVVLDMKHPPAKGSTRDVQVRTLEDLSDQVYNWLGSCNWVLTTSANHPIQQENLQRPSSHRCPLVVNIRNTPDQLSDQIKNFGSEIDRIRAKFDQEKETLEEQATKLEDRLRQVEENVQQRKIMNKWDAQTFKKVAKWDKLRRKFNQSRNCFTQRLPNVVIFLTLIISCSAGYGIWALNGFIAVLELRLGGASREIDYLKMEKKTLRMNLKKLENTVSSSYRELRDSVHELNDTQTTMQANVEKASMWLNQTMVDVKDVSEEVRADRHEYREANMSAYKQVMELHKDDDRRIRDLNQSTHELGFTLVQREDHQLRKANGFASTLVQREDHQLRSDVDNKIRDLNQSTHELGFTLVQREDHELRNDVDRKIRDLNQSMHELGFSLVQREDHQLRNANGFASALVQREDHQLRKDVNRKIRDLSQSTHELGYTLVQREDHKLRREIDQKTRDLNQSTHELGVEITAENRKRLQDYTYLNKTMWHLGTTLVHQEEHKFHKAIDHRIVDLNHSTLEVIAALQQREDNEFREERNYTIHEIEQRIAALNRSILIELHKVNDTSAAVAKADSSEAEESAKAVDFLAIQNSLEVAKVRAAAINSKIRALNESTQELVSALAQQDDEQLRGQGLHLTEAINSKIGALNDSTQKLVSALVQRDDAQLRGQGQHLTEAINSNIRALNESTHELGIALAQRDDKQLRGQGQHVTEAINSKITALNKSTQELGIAFSQRDDKQLRGEGQRLTEDIDRKVRDLNESTHELRFTLVQREDHRFHKDLEQRIAALNHSFQEELKRVKEASADLAKTDSSDTDASTKA